MTRDEMLNELRTKMCVVNFTKVNGEERVMTCTLVPERIPEEKQPVGNWTVNQNYSDEVIRVFNTTLQEWRSFRVDSVNDFRSL